MAVNDLPTNLLLIDEYTKNLAEAVQGAQETTESHERFIRGSAQELIQTDQGSIKSLTGQIEDWKQGADAQVSDQLVVYDQQFDAQINEFDDEFVAYLLTLGFKIPEDYAAGIVISERAQTVSYQGNIYFWTGTLPFTTSGTFANDTEFQIAPILGGVKAPTFTFDQGGTLFTKTDSVLGTDGQWYYWSGSFPKVIPNGSTIISVGGEGNQKFKTSGGYINLRSTLDMTLKGSGHVLNAKTFETGATLVATNELLLEASSGRLYKWMGTIPKVVDFDSTPDTTGGINDTNWVEFNEYIEMFKYQVFLKNYGYDVVGNFIEGCSLSNKYNLVLGVDKKLYFWGGSFPKNVVSMTDPTQDVNWKITNVKLPSSITDEVIPSYGVQGLEWYKPSTSQTFIYYIGPNNVGHWVEKSPI